MTDINVETPPMERKLDFALIGAKKCATSWMYYCLRDHPALCVPDKKLEAGYIGGKMFMEKGEDWFFQRFKDTQSALRGDISVEYLYDPTSPAALRPYLDDPKFILSLRNPVDRLVSDYYWLIRRGQIENAPLEQGIELILDQQAGFPAKIDGPLEEIVRRGCYAPQLQRYIDLYGAESMFIALYENVGKDGLATIQSMYRYLGVDPTFVPPSLGSAPKRNSYNKALLFIENKFPNKVVAKLINYTNQAITTVKPPKEILSSKLRNKLNTLYAPNIQDAQEVMKMLPAGHAPTTQESSDAWGKK